MSSENELPDHEGRIKALEKSFDEIIHLLKSIESRLIGGLKSEEIGLISEVHQLQRDMREWQACVSKCKEKLNTLDRQRWMLWGGLFLLAFMIKAGPWFSWLLGGGH